MEVADEIEVGYKMTKMGLIPEEWNTTFIGDIADIQTGAKDTQDKVDDGKYPFFVRSQTIERINSYSFDGEAVLTSGDGVGVGKIYHYLNCKFDYHQRVYNIHNFSQKIIGIFFFHFFSQHFYKRVIRLSAKNSVDSVRRDMIAKMIIPLPPLPEQKKIADILSTWDKAIETTQALIEKLQLRKKGLMQQLLSGKKRLPGFSREWSSFKIDDLFSKAERYVIWDEEESYSLISIRRRYGGIFHRKNEFGKNIGVKKLKTIASDDFLISKRQVSHGAWVVVKSEFKNMHVSNEYDCLKINDIDILNPKFWYWFIQQKMMTNLAFLDSIGVHIEKLIFHYSLFKKRDVKIPNSIKEQTAIAEVLTKADEEIDQIQHYLEQLQAQKKGLMQQLLTGQKRVKV